MEIRELTPKLWPEFEELFEPNGPCAGCWCMWWRLPEGERFMEVHGACSDVEGVWSLPCFFVKAGWRGRGVARALLRGALASLKRRGARIAEAYPVRLPASNASAFTGTVPWLESEGFRILTDRPRGRQRARKAL